MLSLVVTRKSHGEEEEDDESYHQPPSSMLRQFGLMKLLVNYQLEHVFESFVHDRLFITKCEDTTSPHLWLCLQKSKQIRLFTNVPPKNHRFIHSKYLTFFLNASMLILVIFFSV